MGMMILLSIFLGTTLAAASGFRAFLPLFMLGLLERFELLAPFSIGENFQWLSSTPALIALGTATVLEIAADKIPAVDSALDTVMTFVRPATGGVSVLAVLSYHNPLVAYVSAVVLAGGATLPIHLGKGTLRLGSHLTTGGFASPAISTAEDATSIGVVSLAILLPICAVIFGAGALILILWLVNRRRRSAK